MARLNRLLIERLQGRGSVGPLAVRDRWLRWRRIPVVGGSGYLLSGTTGRAMSSPLSINMASLMLAIPSL